MDRVTPIPNLPAAGRAGLRGARNRWLIPSVAVATVLLVVGIAALIWRPWQHKPSASATSSVAASASTPAHASSAPAPRVVAAGELESLLLGTDGINAAMGVSGLGLQDTYSDLGRLNDGGEHDILDFTPMDCLSAAFSTMEADYVDSGYTGVQGREMTETDGSYKYWVDEAVVSFPGAADASAFLARSRDVWRGCSGTSFELTRAGDRYEQWILGDINASGDVISILKSAIGTRPWACSHARGAKANVVADVFACGEGTVTNQSTTIVNQILTRIPNT